MKNNSKFKSSTHLLDELFNKVFDDDVRVLAIIDVPEESLDAVVADLGNTMRYMGLALLKDKLNIDSLEPGIDTLIDKLEARSIKHMRNLILKSLASRKSSEHKSSTAQKKI